MNLGSLGNGISKGRNFSSGGFIRYSFDEEGMASMIKNTEGMSTRVKDLRPIWPIIRDDFSKRMNTLYMVRAGNVGGAGRWAELKDSYAKRKLREGFRSTILVRTGNLLESLMIPNHPDFVYRPRRQSLTLGTTIPYAGYHFRSYTYDSGYTRPAREPIRISKEQKRFYVSLINAYITKGEVDGY